MIRITIFDLLQLCLSVEQLERTVFLRIPFKNMHPYPRLLYVKKFLSRFLFTLVRYCAIFCAVAIFAYSINLVILNLCCVTC